MGPNIGPSPSLLIGDGKQSLKRILSTQYQSRLPLSKENIGWEKLECATLIGKINAVGFNSSN